MENEKIANAKASVETEVEKTIEKVDVSQQSSVVEEPATTGRVNPKKSVNVRNLVGIGLFTAIVVVLQLFGSSIKFGMFSISLVLVPIVVGAAVYGWKAGGWLGFAFGMTVLLSGDAQPFFVVNAVGTVLTVLTKGIACGLVSGLVYTGLRKLIKGELGIWVAVIAAAIVCPIVNTGVFLVGCVLFFLPTITEWGTAAGFPNAAAYMFLGLAGVNFLVELVTDLVLSPAITRLIKIGKKQ